MQVTIFICTLSEKCISTCMRIHAKIRVTSVSNINKKFARFPLFDLYLCFSSYDC